CDSSELAGPAAAGVVDAVRSAWKSEPVGGGCLGGSGRGTAASIASSAGVAREGSCAIAEVADTVRKVAATAIRTRSNPPRLFRQSRIVAPLGWLSCPGVGQIEHHCRPASAQAGPVKSIGLHSSIHTQTIQMRQFCGQPRPGHSRQTDSKRYLFATDPAFLPRATAFVCHPPATVHVFRNR